LWRGQIAEIGKNQKPQKGEYRQNKEIFYQSTHKFLPTAVYFLFQGLPCGKAMLSPKSQKGYIKLKPPADYCKGRFGRGKRAVLSYHLSKTITLVGLMGAGKTAVGSWVAQELSVPFVDSDAEIVKAANMSIAEIFTRDGESFFRDRETQVLERLLLGAACILSTGGGAYLAQRNRALISQHGAALWLRADLDLLWSRVRHKTTRPLLQTGDPRQTLSDLYDARVPIYAKAEIAVTSEPGLSIEAMGKRVIKTLLNDPQSGVTLKD